MKVTLIIIICLLMITMVEAQVKTPDQAKQNSVQYNPDGKIGSLFLDIGGAFTFENDVGIQPDDVTLSNEKFVVLESSSLLQIGLGMPVNSYSTIFIGFERVTNTTTVGLLTGGTTTISTNGLRAKLRIYIGEK